MTRYSALLLALFALSSLAACGDADSVGSSPGSSSENNSAVNNSAENNSSQNNINNSENNTQNNSAANSVNNSPSNNSPDNNSPDNNSPSCDAQCTAPPPASCFDGTTQQLYDAAGTCDEDGACVYTPSQAPCDAPPADACASAGSVLRYEDAGTCAGGECAYASREVACDEAPAPRCDGDTLKLWDETPRCEGGACVYATRDVECGDAGCCEDHCCTLAVSNDDAFGALGESDLRLGPPNGTFHTLDDCTPDAALGACTLLEGEPGACVCRSQHLVIGDIEVLGPNRLVLLASEVIEVEGHLDVSARGSVRGGPGSYGTELSLAQGRSGGQGAAYAAAGGGGSDALIYGTPELVPLLPGTRGQHTCGPDDGYGGWGGGALQLSAGERIVITGRISASGGGGGAGSSGDSCNGGAGGGSGGGILIEAPEVDVRGGVFANGGGGGGGGSSDYDGTYGSNGAQSATGRALGGSSVEDATCALYGSIYSGSGGLGSGDGFLGGASGTSGDYETRCLGSTYSGDGGGGGAAGRIRINTLRAQQGCICSGDFSPAPTFGAITYQ